MSLNLALRLGAVAPAAASFAPTDLAGLAAWYDASDASTFTYSSGVVVSQWNDKSGNARHLTQGTVANQPSRSGTQNGLSTVVYDGTNDVMSVAWTSLTQNGFVAVSFTGASGVTQVVVGYGNDRYPIFNNSSNGSSGYILTGGVGSSNTTTTFRTAASVMSTSSPRVWLNGTLTTGTSTSSGSGGTLTVGAGGSFFLNGSIGEVVIYTTVPAGPDITQVLNYLKNKWGTP